MRGSTGTEQLRAQNGRFAKCAQLREKKAGNARSSRISCGKGQIYLDQEFLAVL